MTPAREGHFCAQCGERLDDARLAKNPGQRFCSSACSYAYRRAHPDEYRRQREATADANHRRWREWRAAGIDPAHSEEAAAKRGEAIAESNRATPRRKRKED